MYWTLGWEKDREKKKTVDRSYLWELHPCPSNSSLHPKIERLPEWEPPRLCSPLLGLVSRRGQISSSLSVHVSEQMSCILQLISWTVSPSWADLCLHNLPGPFSLLHKRLLRIELSLTFVGPHLAHLAPKELFRQLGWGLLSSLNIAHSWKRLGSNVSSLWTSETLYYVLSPYTFPEGNCWSHSRICAMIPYPF